MALDDIIKESQTTPLSAQRTFSDTGKVGITVELQTVEYCHDTDILHPTILHNGIEDYLPMGIHILQFMPCDGLQEGGDGEDGTGTEPTAHVVTGDMVEHGVIGNLEDQ